MNGPAITLKINGHEQVKIIESIRWDFDHPMGKRMVLEFHGGDSLDVEPGIGKEIVNEHFADVLGDTE